MNTKTTSKSSLFLMELIIAILFFALAGTVCIQLFVKAHILGQSTIDLNQSILWSQNLAETYLACDGDLKKICEAVPEGQAVGSEFVIYFDSSWKSCTHNEASYKAVLSTLPEENALIYADITVSKQSFGDSLYHLEIKKHIQGKGQNLE